MHRQLAKFLYLGFYGLAGLLAAGCNRSTSTSAVIEGRSMAPRWMGAHVASECRDCGLTIHYYLPAQSVEIVCPNCGYELGRPSFRKIPSESLKVGQLTEPLRRWEVAVFSHPESTDGSPKLAIKRVVGMPGESLQIREGDIWADGTLLRKDWKAQRATAIPVHDSFWEPKSTEGVLRRWAPNPLDGTEWQQEGGTWVGRANGQTGSCLEYTHLACFRNPQSRRNLQPVLNVRPFEPAESGEFSRARDLLLLMELQARQATFAVRLQFLEPEVFCRFDSVQQKVTMHFGASPPREIAWRPPGNSFQLGVSSFDRAITVVVDGHTLGQWDCPFDLSNDEARLAHPWSIELTAGTIEIGRRQVFRDIWYLPSATRVDSEPFPQLGPEEYLMLGDNPVDSRDSRHWRHPGVTRENVLGRIEMDCAEGAR